MVHAKKYVVQKYFRGEPKRDDYKLITYELPSLKEGEVLVKAEWISVDPYLRAYNSSNQVPYDQFSYQVGVVIETRNTDFPVGTKVVSFKGWCDHYIFNPNDETLPHEKIYEIPDLQGESESLALGAVGIVGATAYFGFLEICQPKPGETVVVTGAAGAVGSLVGQIAKIKGCKVIGFAGSDDKVKWLEQELGFDHAFNYKTVNVLSALKQAAPNGIDCYFDNVGGEISSMIISQMNLYGRISVCGSISSYNNDSNNLPKATTLQPSLLFKQLKMQGFLAWRWEDKSKVYADIVSWIKTGKLKVREHVTEGFENLFDAFVGMLKGENYGKAVVKV